MALDKENAALDATGAWLHEQLAAQPWYRRYANTVTAASGLAATVLAWVAAQPFAADPRWQLAVLLAGFVLTVIGVNRTPNGWSPSQVQAATAGVAEAVKAHGDYRPGEEGAENV